MGAFRSLLGIWSDAEIAARAGVTVEAYGSIELTPNSIASSRAWCGGFASASTECADPYWDRLGQESDSDIAVLAGVTAENVRAFRQRHGIEAAWKGARSRIPQASLDDERSLVGSSDSKLVPASVPMQGFLVSIQGP